MNKTEMIEEVNNRTEVGKAIVLMELNYLKWITKKQLEKQLKGEKK